MKLLSVVCTLVLLSVTTAAKVRNESISAL